MTARHDDLFDGWRAPSVPVGLDRRVLAAARNPNFVAIPRRIEDRIWESARLRVAWLAAASLLVALNLLVAGPLAPVIAGHPAEVATSSAEGLDNGVEVPSHDQQVTTVGDSDTLAIAILMDPCAYPSIEGDCT